MNELLKHLTVGDLIAIRGIPFIYHGYEADDEQPGMFSIHLSSLLEDE